MLHPAFPQTAFTIVQKQTAEALEGELESPSTRVVEELRKALYPEDDPKTREADPQTVSKLTLGDVLSYYREVFRPDMTTIVVIGNVTPEQARAVIEKHFGAWKATGPRPETDLAPAPLNKKASSVVPDESRVQDEVRLVRILGLTRRTRTTTRCRSATTSCQGRSMRHGCIATFAKQPVLSMRSSPTWRSARPARSSMSFSRAIPRMFRRLGRRVEGNLRAMQTKRVSAEELRQAKALLVRKVPLSEASVETIGQVLLKNVQEELPLDEPQQAAEKYLRVTAEQVRSAFQKWIRPNAFVQVTQGPEPR